MVGHLDSKRPAASIEVLTAYINTQSATASAYALRAQLLGCEATPPDIQGAYVDAKRALELPDDHLGFRSLAVPIAAKAALQLGHAKESLSVLEGAIVHDPSDANQLLQSHSGKVEQLENSLCQWGLEDFSKLANAAPNDWRVPLVRGLYYASLVNLQDQTLFAIAVSEYRKASVLNSKSAIPHYLQAEIEMKQAMFSSKNIGNPAAQKVGYLGVVPAYTAAINAEPSFTRAYMGRAEAYLNARDNMAAIRDFTTVLSREPQKF